MTRPFPMPAALAALLAAAAALAALAAPASAAGQDWPQRMVGVAGLAERGLDGRGVVVAVLDSGFDKAHPDLAGRAWTDPADPPNGLDDDLDGYPDDAGGWDFCRGAPNRETPGYYHGTLVASLVAGKGGTPGVAPGATLMEVTVLCDDNDYPPMDAGSPLARDPLREALRYAIRHGADVILMSLQKWPDHPPGAVAGLLPYEEEFADAAAKGILVVAAAGNLGHTGPSSPADRGGVVAVGADTGCGYRHAFSNHGAGVDVWAPGRAYGARLGGGHQWGVGTSFAAPIVAGAAALLIQEDPGRTPTQLRSLLLDGARATDDGRMMDLHAHFGLDPGPAPGPLRLVSPDATDGTTYLQFAADGPRPDLVDVKWPGGRSCLALADPANATLYARPAPGQPIEVAVRGVGPGGAGPWTDVAVRHQEGAGGSEPRPILVDAPPPAAPAPAAPLPPVLAALALTGTWWRRRRPCTPAAASG